ncbi:MAG TPA: ribonuclease HI family protein [Gemmatimonadales bacterium]|nr:ribonuclease HI family protein [Gemmatimonadales bacterium]
MVAAYIDHVKLFADGGCRGNPGPGAVAALVLNASDNVQLDFEATCIGTTTNNRAEYSAVIQGLNVCARHTRGRVTCYTDSQLVVNHMNGTWRLKDDALRRLFLEARQCEQVFREVVYTHVSRDNLFIKRADRALNDAFEGKMIA